MRLQIVALLRERAASTTELAEQVGLAKGTVAHHLKVLERRRADRVVRTRRVRALTESIYGRVARLYVLKSAEDEDGGVRLRLRLARGRVALQRGGSSGCAGTSRRWPPRRARSTSSSPTIYRQGSPREARPTAGSGATATSATCGPAETVSQIGSQINELAMPLVAIIVLDASAFEVALLGVIEFALHPDQPARRRLGRPAARKPILVTGDFGRALLLVISIPVAYWLDVRRSGSSTSSASLSAS